MNIKNPNATVALGAGLGGSQIVINLAQHLFGWGISTGWATAIAGGAASAVLFFWDKGIAGAWNRIMHGKQP